MHPRLFLEKYVEPNIREWGHNQLDVRIATATLCAIDNLVEHLINHTTTNAQINRERERLASLCRWLSFVRDVHDTHKHGKLCRKTARITNGQELKLRSYGAAVAEAAVAEAPVAGDIDELFIILDDGAPYSVPATISASMHFLKQEIDKLPHSI